MSAFKKAAPWVTGAKYTITQEFRVWLDATGSGSIRLMKAGEVVELREHPEAVIIGGRDNGRTVIINAILWMEEVAP